MKWRTSKSWPRVQVSNEGRLRHTETKEPKHIKLDGKGYPTAVFTLRGKRCYVLVHKLVAEAFIGARPPGYDINHKDSDRQNNSVRNLEYRTRAHNCQHAIENGRRPTEHAKRLPGQRGKGSNHHKAKLAEAQVREIRQRHWLGGRETLRELAAEYGVSRGTISAIRYGRHWRHVRTWQILRKVRKKI